MPCPTARNLEDYFYPNAGHSKVSEKMLKLANLL